jgi:hypothetical protein
MIIYTHREYHCDTDNFFMLWHLQIGSNKYHHVLLTGAIDGYLRSLLYPKTKELDEKLDWLEI